MCPGLRRIRSSIARRRSNAVFRSAPVAVGFGLNELAFHQPGEKVSVACPTLAVGMFSRDSYAHGKRGTCHPDRIESLRKKRRMSRRGIKGAELDARDEAVAEVGEHRPRKSAIEPSRRLPEKRRFARRKPPARRSIPCRRPRLSEAEEKRTSLSGTCASHDRGRAPGHSCRNDRRHSRHGCPATRRKT
jgi:hypothetical protein